ncbi:hypothetical protein BCR44DRAFT_1171523 [Catenaria anguillulae PL171]|uniref:Secreted protein n=1 Tax=Catenaria anguillulae PL171 TaxID=765915 RepID=A0A1Y2I2T6_9FUNG|nr:hypothetical protein BCR44DRAFT_1171523 [Catenaria anguillulae PL171]
MVHSPLHFLWSSVVLTFFPTLGQHWLPPTLADRSHSSLSCVVVDMDVSQFLTPPDPTFPSHFHPSRTDRSSFVARSSPSHLFLLVFPYISRLSSTCCSFHLFSSMFNCHLCSNNDGWTFRFIHLCPVLPSLQTKKYMIPHLLQCCCARGIVWRPRWMGT